MNLRVGALMAVVLSVGVGGCGGGAADENPFGPGPTSIGGSPNSVESAGVLPASAVAPASVVEPASASATGAGVTMTLPAGWVWRSSNDELVAASSDGSATVRVHRMSSSGLDLAALEASLDGVEVSVRGEPATVVVDGHEGVSIELEETRSAGVFVVKLVIVPVGNEAFRFEAAGPIAMWDSVQTDITAMVIGTRFAP